MVSVVEIERMKRIQLEMLDELDRICRKHKILYHLAMGTLLGAVRHAGYIPWDDDIDVVMSRSDYEFFLRIAADELGEDYFVQNHRTEKNYHLTFTKIRRNQTVALEAVSKNIDIHHGIYIDIFPLDPIPSSKPLKALLVSSVWILHNMLALKIKERVLRSRNNALKLLKVIVHYGLYPVSNHFINGTLSYVLSGFNKADSKFYTIFLEPDLKLYKKFRLPIDKYTDVVEVKFEDRVFFAPKDYHEILQGVYGDYLTHPPVEQQKSHHIFLKIVTD